jgi:hypothetical protein
LFFIIRISNDIGVACSTYGEVHTGFWWGNLRERDHLEEPGIDGIFMKLEEAWTGLIWFRIGTDDGHL